MDRSARPGAARTNRSIRNPAANAIEVPAQAGPGAAFVMRGDTMQKSLLRVALLLFSFSLVACAWSPVADVMTPFRNKPDVSGFVDDCRAKLKRSDREIDR